MIDKTFIIFELDKTYQKPFQMDEPFIKQIKRVKSGKEILDIYWGIYSENKKIRKTKENIDKCILAYLKTKIAYTPLFKEQLLNSDINYRTLFIKKLFIAKSILEDEQI